MINIIAILLCIILFKFKRYTSKRYSSLIKKTNNNKQNNLNLNKNNITNKSADIMPLEDGDQEFLEKNEYFKKSEELD